MPGYLGGSSGSSGGTGGEITFPKEFIDPVTKLRVSQPENLIDTDFEYGLQPTKWETVELINNTPSFFSKSGDTTIPGIISIATNNGTREITVITATDHGLAVGIPINVTGTKSVTADGSYVINSIPNSLTFTYLCKDEQIGNNAIEDLYSSIITGEFFQGSQIRIADSEGITTDAEPVSTLTVKTDSTHGFGINTPFYFLNLNSTISQEFEASNTAAKSFDSSNSATAQTFDGSNSLSTFNIDWSNSATVGGTTSTISTVNTTNDTITVTHGAETFASQPLGTPLYYNLTTPASSGYFLTNPRGVVFLKTTNALNSPAGSSTFQVSAVPDGDVIDITSSMAGTFQLANQARTFAGNNVNASTQVGLTVVKNTAVSFEANNSGELHGNRLCTVASYSGSLVNVTTTAGAGLGYYTGAMVLYSTTGSAASGLTNNTTYFIDTFFLTGTDTYSFTLKPLPTSSAITSISGGTGTQTFSRIGLSFDKEVVHVRNSNFAAGDLIEYSYPSEGSQFNLSTTRNYYYIATAYDAHNYILGDSTYAPFSASGGNSTTEISANGYNYRVHTFTSTGSSTLTVNDLGSGGGVVEVLLVAGGGGGGSHVAGGGGGGGMIQTTTTITSTGNKTVVVGAGAARIISANTPGGNGSNTTFNGLTAVGGGGGGTYRPSAVHTGADGGSGGGGGGSDSGAAGAGGAATSGQGFAGGNNGPRNGQQNTSGAGGGGAGARGHDRRFAYDPFSRNGGDGLPSYISGTNYWFAGGGGSGTYTGVLGGRGGYGGGGGGSANNASGGAGDDRGLNTAMSGINSGGTDSVGGDGAANTGGGGGGAGGGSGGAYTSAGGSGIAIIRYKISELVPSTITATGGTTATVTLDGTTYRTHRFNTVGANSFTVSSVGSNANPLVDILVVAGGGGGGTLGNQGSRAAGGGAGGLIYIKNFPLAVGTYTATVGNGGTVSVNGQNSVFSGNGRTLTAIGGGKGGDSDGTANAAAGGSGGGQWYPGYEGAASNQPRNINDGLTTWINCGYGTAGGHSYNHQPYAGGGGGAGGRGRGVDSLGGPQGGVGIQLDITGTPTYFAGGGGGAGFPPETSTYLEYAGGLGGGGKGSNDSFDVASNGTANTGGGGGSGGSGGSGTIIIRYPIGVA